MKHGKRPTVREKKALYGHGLNPDEWLIVKRTPDFLTVEHRVSGAVRSITTGESTWNEKH